MTAPSYVYAAGDASPPLVIALTRNGAAIDLTGRTANAVVDRSSAGLANLNKVATIANPATEGQVSVNWVPGDLANPSADGTTVYYLVDVVLDFGLPTQETMPSPVVIAVRSTASSVYGGLEPGGEVPVVGGGDDDDQVQLWAPVPRPVHVNAAYDARAGDVVLADATAGTFVVRVPNDGRPGDVIRARNIGTANVVTIEPTGGAIDGVAQLVLALGEAVELVYDGAQWWAF